MSISRRTLRAIVIVAAIGASILASQYLERHYFDCFYLPSEAMAPTLVPGDRIGVSKYAYRVRTPKLAEVVVFEAPLEVATRGEALH